MRTFKEFGITVDIQQSFTGEKIPMKRLLNKEIIIHDFRVVPSQFKNSGDGNRMDMQITVDGIQRIGWTNSLYLRNQIEKVDRKTGFPFKATIIENNGHYEFT